MNHVEKLYYLWAELITNQSTQKRKYQKPNTLSITHYHNPSIQIVWRCFEAFSFLYYFRITVRVSRNWICDWDACNSFVWFCVYDDDTIVCNVVDCGSNMFFVLSYSFFFIFLLFFLSLALKCISQHYSSSFHSLKTKNKMLARVHILIHGSFVLHLFTAVVWIMSFLSFLFDLSFVSFNSFRLPLVRIVLWPIRRVAL